MSSLNLGILAHVDAGKTSLTERLLHTAGIIDEIGSVDAGSTHTDSLALERRRGITIKSAVVSFPIGGRCVNLIDTPGHPDFIAEVERVLSVLDGAVLVVSAVEGVQAQTRVLARTLRRLRIPTLIFVNKLDRGGASLTATLDGIDAKLTAGTVSMSTATGDGTPRAAVRAHGPGDEPFTARMADVIADHDEDFLTDYVTDPASVTYERMRRALAGLTARGLAHPVFAGSAITGAGVGDLAAGIAELLPAASGEPEAPASGSVFKVDRGPAGERLAYVRVFDGTLRTRDRLPFGAERPGDLGRREGKVTGIRVFEHGRAVERDAVTAGSIAVLRGLGDVRIGDAVGEPRGGARRHFSPPTLETVVDAVEPGGRGAMHAALAQLAEQDPLIGLRQDDERGEVYVSLYGEVQKEVIAETLAAEFGVDVSFRETTTVCIERPVGVGAAVEHIAKEPNPFLATVGLRVEPAPLGTGPVFRLGIELGSMPLAFIKAVETTVLGTLRQGLHGWDVTDVAVTLAESRYWARQSHSHGSFDPSMSSTAGDFRNLTPLVLMEALRRAGTTVLEPLHAFRLEIPADAYGRVLPALGKVRAVPRTTTARGATYVLEGDLPAASVHGLEQRLPALAHGEGVLESAFDRYEPVTGAVPSRARTDLNPLNRREYLLRLTRRVA